MAPHSKLLLLLQPPPQGTSECESVSRDLWYKGFLVSEPPALSGGWRCSWRRMPMYRIAVDVFGLWGVRPGCSIGGNACSAFCALCCGRRGRLQPFAIAQATVHKKEADVASGAAAADVALPAGVALWPASAFLACARGLLYTKGNFVARRGRRVLFSARTARCCVRANSLDEWPASRGSDTRPCFLLSCTTTCHNRFAPALAPGRRHWRVF